MLRLNCILWYAVNIPPYRCFAKSHFFVPYQGVLECVCVSRFLPAFPCWCVCIVYECMYTDTAAAALRHLDPTPSKHNRSLNQHTHTHHGPSLSRIHEGCGRPWPCPRGRWRAAAWAGVLALWGATAVYFVKLVVVPPTNIHPQIKVLGIWLYILVYLYIFLRIVAFLLKIPCLLSE